MKLKEIVGRHTPGPWITDRPEPTDSVRNVLGNAFGLDGLVPVVCMHLHPNKEMRGEQEANALLIACAPLMKEACIEAAGYLLRKPVRTEEEEKLMQMLMHSTSPYSGVRAGSDAHRFAHEDPSNV